MPIRGLGLEPFSAQTPSAQRRHGRLGPSLINKDEPPRINLHLIGFPARPLAGDVSPVLLARQDGFFEAQTFAMDEAPDRPAVHLETTAGKFCYKTTQGDPLARSAREERRHARPPEAAAGGRPSSRPQRSPSPETAATILPRLKGRGSVPEQPHVRSRLLGPAQQRAHANPSNRVLPSAQSLRLNPILEPKTRLFGNPPPIQTEFIPL